MMTLIWVAGPSETQADALLATKKATRASAKKNGQAVKIAYTEERARMLSSICTGQAEGVEFWCGNQYRTDWRIMLVK